MPVNKYSPFVWIIVWISCFQAVIAYGQLGHYVIGEVVYKSLKNETKDALQSCGFLAPFNDSMGIASTWADTIKGNPRYRWTSPFHYYDIDNDPPNYCGIFARPPSNRTINLYNGVRRSLNNHTCSSDMCCGSKFHNGMLLHLLQDAFQPLHLTGKSRGGNEEWFVKDGVKYNLHRFWDTIALDLLLKDEDAFGREEAVAYFHDKIKQVEFPEKGCPVAEKDARKDARKNSRKDSRELLNYVFSKSQEVLNKNCDIVWNTQRDDYIKIAQQTVQSLIIMSITTLNCALEYIYGNMY